MVALSDVISNITYNTDSAVISYENGVTTTMATDPRRGWLDTIHTANQQISFICEERGCHFFDLCSHFEDSFDELFDFDGVHLSNLGYRLWASRLDEYLRKLLAKPLD